MPEQFSLLTTSPEPKTVSFWYTNYKNERELRKVILLAFGWDDKPGFGYEPGWFLRAFDIDRQAERSFRVDGRMQPLDGAEPELIRFPPPQMTQPVPPMPEVVKVKFGPGLDLDTASRRAVEAGCAMRRKVWGSGVYVTWDHGEWLLHRPDLVAIRYEPSRHDLAARDWEGFIVGQAEE